MRKDKTDAPVYNEAIISKLINDFVYSGDVTEKDFKKLLNKEFTIASKRKQKEEASVKKCFKDFINDFEKRSKKAIALLK